MKLNDLKFDKRNYRRHSDKNKEIIKKSIDEVGFGRSIVIDSENEIVCGNGVVSQVDSKTPIKVVETDGSELIVVKRTDLATNDAKRKQLAVMDNSASDTSDFDLELLKEDFSVDELNDWGISYFEEDDEIEDIETIDDVSNGYNIIIKCANYDEAQSINQKFGMELDLDSQRLVIQAEKLL